MVSLNVDHILPVSTAASRKGGFIPTVRTKGEIHRLYELEHVPMDPQKTVAGLGLAATTSARPRTARDKYIEHEARRRGISFEAANAEISQLEADVNALMPSMSKLAELASSPCKAWLDDDSWADIDR